MHAHAGGAPPRQVRLRLNEQRHVLVPSYMPPGHAWAGQSPTPAPSTPPTPEQPGAGAVPATPPVALGLVPKPVVALIEVAVAGAEGLAHCVLEVLEAGGYRGGAISLDGQNRLGALLGCPTPSPNWCWKHAAPELLVTQGAHTVVPGPVTETDLTGPEVEGVLQKVCDQADGVVILLGARWQPRLFRPVLARATHIWLVAQAGLWSGVETRLEQAEFSGWAAVDQIRLVVIGPGGPVPDDLGVVVAGVLPDTEGRQAHTFVMQELGRANREGAVEGTPL